MKKVIIASANPAKIKSVRLAFEQVFQNESFDFTGTESPSGVSAQPMDEEETFQGAINRIDFIRSYHRDADFWVSIEGGLRMNHNNYEAFAWIVIRSNELIGKAKTATFELPEEINQLIDQGLELGHADDKIFNRKDSKRKNGSVGILTQNIIDRSEYYRHAVVLALIPFLNPELNFNGKT